MLASKRVFLCKKLLPAAGVISALRAQSWKKRHKMSSQGLSAPGPKKSKTESKKSRNRKLHFFLLTPFSTFWAPGTHFPTLFLTLGPEDPNDPCSRGRASKRVFSCFPKASSQGKNSKLSWRVTNSLAKLFPEAFNDKVRSDFGTFKGLFLRLNNPPK